MQYKELLQKTADELRASVEVLRQRLAGYQRQVGIRAIKNVRELRVLRKDIARIETRLAEMQRQVPTT